MEHGKAMYVFVACFVSLSIFVRGILICHPWLPLMPHYSLHREHWSTAPAHTHSGWIFSPLQCTAALHPSNGTSVELFYFEILTILLHFWTGTTTLPQTDTRCVLRISDSSVSRSAGVQQPGICSAEAPHAAIMTICTSVQQCSSPAQSGGECINKEVLTGKYPECQSAVGHRGLALRPHTREQE